MFVKLIVIVCSLAVVSARYRGPLAGGLPASQYPAGLDPRACPNFPNCINPAVAVVQVPEQTLVIPQQYRPAPVKQPQQQQQQPPPSPKRYIYRPQQLRSPQYRSPQYPQSPQPQVNLYRLPQQYPAPPQNQYTPEEQKALDRGEYIGDGDYHGEGLAEALAPGYSDQQQRYKAGPVFKFHVQPVQAPASTKPCPNYPYCR